jgi:hypothetical protein
MRSLATTAGALSLLVAGLSPTEVPAATPAHQAHLSANARLRRGSHRWPKRTVARAAIIGGTRADGNAFPQLAFIVFRNGKTGFTCTGTVVAANVVLTAGHCVEDKGTGRIYEPSGYAVVTGNVAWTATSRQESRVSRVVVHPDLNRTYLSDDAALLILSTPTAAPAITLASSPSDSARLQPGTRALIAGWGNTYPGQAGTSERLSWARTEVQQASYCESNAGRFYESYEICTIDPPNYETGICSGDSGGPLLSLNPAGSSYIELGVASHVNSECSPKRPSVFTRADLIAPWVNEWIAAVKPPARNSRTLGRRTPASPTPPNTPGYYVTRPSRTRKILIRVSRNGKHIIGVSIKMPVTCKHGYDVPLEHSWLSYTDNVAITSHIARTTLHVPPDRESKAGAIRLFVGFTPSGSLEGRLRVHIPSRSPRVGLCSGTLRFAAKT